MYVCALSACWEWRVRIPVYAKQKYDYSVFLFYPRPIVLVILRTLFPPKYHKEYYARIFTNDESPFVG